MVDRTGFGLYRKNSSANLPGRNSANTVAAKLQPNKPDSVEFSGISKRTDMPIAQVVNKLKELDYVDSIVLAGSRTGLAYDEKSDYDIYVYSSKRVPLEFRKKLAHELASRAEVGNDFFDDGDELILKNGAGADLMYRDLNWVKEQVKNVWQEGNASVGFSTAFIHNLKTSKILYDKNGKFKALQDELKTPYPQKLKENIIKKNYPLLRSKMTASFYEQIEKAVERNDLVSQNHRTTALLNSYFDIIFAVNEQTHPGEKKLVEWAQATCKVLPANFKKNIENVVRSAGSNNILKNIDIMLDEMDVVLAKSDF